MTKTQRDWLTGTALYLTSIGVGLLSGLTLFASLWFGWLILLGLSFFIIIPWLLVLYVVAMYRSHRRARP